MNITRSLIVSVIAATLTLLTGSSPLFAASGGSDTKTAPGGEKKPNEDKLNLVMKDGLVYKNTVVGQEHPHFRPAKAPNTRGQYPL
jgi:hypothetical protein